MNKEQNITHNNSILLETLMLPDLEQLPLGALSDLLINLSRQFVQGMENREGSEQLNILQLKIEAVKNEIHRKNRIEG